MTLTDLQGAFVRSGHKQAEAFLEQGINVNAVRTVRSQLPIAECGEPLVPIAEILMLADPHPYVQAGAPYGALSPWQVRASVANRLCQAQERLEQMQPGFRIFVFDAFRPLTVQAYMIQHECNRLARDLEQLAFDELGPEGQTEIRTRVMQFWAAPNHDPAAPPPHATGAAVDVTLMNDQGQPVAMGTEIDDLTDKAYPSYFKNRNVTFHTNRLILNGVMQQSGFHRNPVEWWHFSYGDQAWALVESIERPDECVAALYGRAC
ncbi:MAG: D-alanyl-D-alanine dipeptidase [Phycisphaerae bacterium]|nr:D-alanyl-D-alanine dipeptidase [Phycisphaerae bacterium]